MTRDIGYVSAQRGIVALGLAGFAITSIVGCDCNQRSKTASSTKPQVGKKSTLRQIHRVAPIYSPSKELRTKMKRIHRLTKDIRRRLEGNIAVGHPAKVLSNAIAQLPRKGSLAEFSTQLARLQKGADQLSHSTTPSKSYDALVGQCVECHRSRGKYWVPELQSLKLLSRRDAIDSRAGEDTETR